MDQRSLNLSDTLFDVLIHANRSSFYRPGGGVDLLLDYRNYNLFAIHLFVHTCSCFRSQAGQAGPYRASPPASRYRLPVTFSQP